jgi:YD repeat-containing protein
VLQHQPHRPLPHLLRVPRRPCHLSILSTNGVSSFPGAVHGLPTSIEDPDGDNTTNAYDSYGDLTSTTNAAGDETTYSYNALGQKLTMVSPDGNVAGGDPSEYQTTYTYNALGEVLTTTDPNGDVTTNTYDNDGNLLTTTDPDGNETLTTYNADWQPIEVATRP